MSKVGSAIKRISKIILWVAISLALLFIIIIVLVQIPTIQNRIIHQATSFVGHKTLTRVEIKKISLSFPGAVIVHGLFLEDLQKDTLLYAGKAKLLISFKDLLFSKIDINYFVLEDAYLNISRPSTDSLFNFNFLLTAFSDTTKQIKAERQPASKWVFGISNVRFRRIRVRFDDEFGGIDAVVKLHKLNLKVDEIDLNKSIYSIDDLQVESLITKILLKQSTRPIEEKSEIILPVIKAKKIQISNSSISYGDSVSKLNLEALVNRFELSKGSIDLQKEIVSVGKVSLSKSTILFNTASKEPLTDSTKLVINALAKENNWVVAADYIELNDNSIAYTVANTPKITNGFDFNHMEYKHINLNASNFYYSSLNTKISVNKFSTVDGHGFSVKKFETDFSMDQHSITAKKLKIKTTNSSIDADLSLQFTSLESMMDSLPFLVLNIDLKSVSILTSDINYFYNQLATQPFFQNETNITTISGKINGSVNNLSGKNLVIKTASKTILKTDFVITGLPDVQTASFNFSDLNIISGKHDIEMMAGSSIPESVELPESISLQVDFKGKIKAFETSLKLNSSFGSAQLAASIDEDENFSSKVSVDSFDLGMLLKDTALLGPVTLAAAATGKGLDRNTIVAKIEAEVSQMYLNKYNYRNLHVDGNARGQEFDGKISLNDENIVFDLDGLMNLDSLQEGFKFRFNLKGADLQKLNLTKEDIRIGLHASANLKGVAVNKLNGKAEISNVIIAKGEKIYELDSLLFASLNETKKSEFNLRSAIVGIKYSGTISPADLTVALSRFINSYFPFSEDDQLAEKIEPSDFTFEIQLHNHPVISQVLLPELTEFEPGIIQGSFSSEKNDLKLNVTMKRVVYGSTEINDFALDVNTDSSALNYKIFSSAVSNTQIKLDNFLIDGKIADKTIHTYVSSISQDQKKKLEVHSQITKENGNYKFSLDQKDFYLMHNRWDIAADNYIEFGKEGFLIHNFFINNTVSQINIFSVNNRFNDDLSIEVKNFKLDDLSRIIEKDTSLVKGKLEGNVLLKRVNNSYGLIADAQISNLIIREVPIGNITLKADNQTAGKFDVDMNLSGTENNLTANGYFIAKEGNNSINIKADIQSLSMKTVEAFSMGQINEASGALSGNFLVKGAIGEPEITGELVFNNAFIKPAYLNNRLELKHETVHFKTDGIYFKSFTIFDSRQHSAIINGSIKMKEFKDLVFALRINASDFQLFNTTARNNKEFFGRMIIDSRIDVNGPLAFPVINARVKVKNGSNFTFAVPESSLTTDKGEDVVEFEDSLKINSILRKKGNITSQKKGYTGFDLSTIIEIDKQATLRLLLDPSSSDSLVVRGEAALSFAIDRSGKMSLTGAYHLNDGSYLVSLESIVKRRFDIIPGSTIIWNGDPLDAEISINAKYTVRAAPYDLLAFQMSTLSDAESSAYKQRYPFWVMLKLRGEILHPVISFEIQLPPDEKGILGGAVNQKLSLLNEDASALNKQVFALLVMGRFIQENPLQTESTGTSALVRATVGKLLSAQLNELSSKVISGVEVNIDIQSYDDYQSGEAEGRTQVEVGVKKQLFQDRLSIQIGGTVDVEGESAKQNTASDITGDVKVEYKLTKDGRYRLKGFRHNQYEGAIEGQLVETGVGVAFVRDFNKWKNLFRRQRIRSDSTRVRNEN
jgi:hypothetical protein